MSLLNRILLGALLISSPFAWGAQSINLAWDASPDPTVVGYSVYYGPAPGNYTNKLDAGAALKITTPVLADGTYYFSATSRNANGIESDFANVLSTNISTTTSGTPPVIATQPSSITVVVGGSASFSVTVSGSAPISFQWRFNGSDILGATNSTFTIASVQGSNAGTYTCFMSNFAGSITTSGATLAVSLANPPLISIQPSDVTRPTGANATFSVAASGTSLSYQWLRNLAPISDGGNVTGSRSPTLSFANVTTADQNNYCVLVSNPWGSVTSRVVILSVTNPIVVVAPSIVTQPSSATVNVGNSFTLAVTAAGSAPLAYQWLFNGNPITGATAASYTISSIQTNNAGTYTCFVSNSAGSITSSGATLTVNVPAIAPTIVSQPVSMTAVPGTSASFNITVSGTAPFSYQWRFNGVDIPGATSTTFTISSAQNGDVGIYTCFVSNSAGSVVSSGANLSLAPGTAPSISVQPSDVRCGSGTNATFSVTASGTSLSYRWLKNIVPMADGGNVTGSANPTLNLANVTTSDQNNFCVIVSNAWGSVTSRVVLLSVTNAVTNPVVVAPSIVTQPSSVTADAGTPATFAVTASGSTPLNYQWLFNGAVIPGATSSTYSIASVRTSNVGAYSCAVSNSAGTVTSADATLAVAALPSTYIVTQPASQTVNATSNLSLTVVVGGTTNNTYQWSKDGSPIANATDSTYTVSNALRANAGSYTVAVTGVGTVTSSPAVVTVIDPVFYLQPVGKAVPIGQSWTFTAAANGTQPLRYQWYVVKSGTIGLLVDQTNTSLTLTSVTANDAGAYYCVANNGNVVQSSNAVLTVNAIAGTYNGLFADASNMSAASSGALLNLVISSNATYSGKIDIAGTSYSLSGKFDSTASSSNLVTRSRGNVVVQLWFDSPDGTISGTVSCAAEGWSVPLRALVTRYSSSNPTQPSSNDVNLLDSNSAIGGHMSITTTSAGAVKMSGRLADSTRISVNAALTSTDQFPVHEDLYSKGGMLHGWVGLSNGIPSGTLMWIKPRVPNNPLNVVVQPVP